MNNFPVLIILNNVIYQNKFIMISDKLMLKPFVLAIVINMFRRNIPELK